MKYKILLYDPSEEYRKRIGTAFAGKYYYQAEFYSADSPVKMLELAVALSPDIILCDAQSAEMLPDFQKKRAAILSGRSDICFRNGLPCINRYLSVSGLFDEAVRLIKLADGKEKAGDKCVSAAFVSFVGGVGCTVSALGFAKAAVRAGKRCVFMSFDPFSVYGASGTDDDCMSELMLYAIENRDNVRELIKRCSSEDESGMYTVRPVSDPSDLADTGNDVKKVLLEYVVGSGLFDVVVSDIPRVCSAEQAELCALHDRIYVVCRDNNPPTGKMTGYLSSAAGVSAGMTQTLIIGHGALPGGENDVIRIPFFENIPKDGTADAVAEYMSRSIVI